MKKESGIKNTSKGITGKKHINNNNSPQNNTAMEQYKDHIRILETILNNSADHIYMADQKKTILYVNPAGAAVLGLTPKKMIGKKWPKLHVPKKILKTFIEYNDHVFRTGKSIKNTITYPAVKGNIEFEYIINPVFNKIRKVIAAVTTARDITEHKRTEDEAKESRNYLDRIINSIADPVFVKDRKHRWIVLNDAFCKFMGYPKEELIGKSDYDYFPRSEAKVFWEKDEIVFKSGKENINEEKFTDAEGITSTILTTKTVYSDIKGNKTLVGIIRDITKTKQAEEERIKRERAEAEIQERKKAERILRDTLEKLREFESIVNRSPAVVFLWKAKEGWPVEFTSSNVTQFGFTAESLTSGKILWQKIIHPDDLERLKAELVYHKKRKVNEFTREYRLITSHKEIRCIEERTRTIIDLRGKITHYQGIILDVTEQKKAQEREAQRINELEFLTSAVSRFLDFAPDNDIYHFIEEKLHNLVGASIVIVNSFDAITSTTKTHALFGAGNKLKKLLKLIGKTLFNISFRLDRSAIERLKSGRLEMVPDVHSLSPEISHVTAKTIKKIFNINSIYSMGFTWEGQLYGNIVIVLRGENRLKNKKTIEAFIRQASVALQRRKAEEALTDERERLTVTLRSIGDGVIATDIKGEIVLMNRIAEKMTGWTQENAKGKSLTKVFSVLNENNRQPAADPVKMVLEKKEIVDIPKNSILISKNKTERVIADSASPIRDSLNNIIGVVIVFRDITDELKIEKELEKAGRLESIGILAGGIAHDFNNILMAILGNLSLLQQETEENDPQYNIFKKIENASLRAKELTQQLLTFSKGGEPIRQTASIEEVIKDSVSFVLQGSNVSCLYSLPNDLWSVKIDRGQISQVIQNLVINANQAMPDGGVIRINALNLILEKGNIEALQPGYYIKITIKDNGTGIPEKYLEKIFDPFFTTKEKGSGLGLSIVYSIISKHDGLIKVDSFQKKGTMFHIYIPACEKRVPRKKETEKITTKESGNILLLDDEESVREATGDMLKFLGYKTVLSSDGAETIKLYLKSKEERDPFDAVIMDLTIPGGMGGKEAVKELLKRDPSARVIVSSGYYNDAVMASYKKYGFCGVIKKPYNINELKRKLHELLKK
ncbi:MAG: PAS domain S-box protein [Spirochaetes bacterium]|nr:PAS domain S-box protein [Spirochaetota bacterium]